MAAEFTSPRSWAFTLIGIDEYLRRFGDRRANQIRESLTAKLMQRYADAATDEWHWFEEGFVRQRQAAPCDDSQRALSGKAMLELGLKTLRWPMKVQDLGWRFPSWGRLERILPAGGKGAVRSTAHRGAGHGFCLHRGVSRDG